MPATVNEIVSELLLPATHSPAAAPEAVFELAASIASRRVHNPSVPLVTSAVLLTVMVLTADGCRLILAGDRTAAK